MAALYAPFGMIFGLIGRYPWPTTIACAAGTPIGFLTGHDVIGVTCALVGSMVMIWIDETTSPRAIDEGVAAGD
ncbi:hypothetical protein [Falsiroseomonas stagni]|uniref:Uncharacterized protein n=1 Tax=Falsiroseomonas stagni DSM 19981 TaxID=1123062 RepID=A0A1I4AS03_9PROT|nr:hypothetical protein [Falsiroseomonas stagni]SFK58671.1 hypothetical protein SAMN02745775_10473 [Falsiroseomonas stagni DSM 19981]